MTIIGMGTKIIDCARVAELIQRYAEGFLDKVYTSHEQEFCQARRFTTEHYAAVWAMKEAVMHSLGTTWKKGRSLREVELTLENPLNPEVILLGSLKQRQEQLQIQQLRVCFSHCPLFATATALALRS